jgi:hypothetical protein
MEVKGSGAEVRSQLFLKSPEKQRKRPAARSFPTFSFRQVKAAEHDMGVRVWSVGGISSKKSKRKKKSDQTKAKTHSVPSRAQHLSRPKRGK